MTLPRACGVLNHSATMPKLALHFMGKRRTNMKIIIWPAALEESAQNAYTICKSDVTILANPQRKIFCSFVYKYFLWKILLKTLLIFYQLVQATEGILKCSSFIENPLELKKRIWTCILLTGESDNWRQLSIHDFSMKKEQKVIQTRTLVPQWNK